MAGEAKLGQNIWLREIDEIVPVEIVSIKVIKQSGMVNLFTLANNIVVDNIVASCHIINHNWQVFDAVLLRIAYLASPSFSQSQFFKKGVKLWDSIFEEKFIKFFAK